jgi:cell division protein FtsB
MRYSIAKKHKKHKWKPITNRMPIFLLCFIILVFLGRAAFKAYNEKKESSKSLESAKEKLAKLEERGMFIIEELTKFSTEGGLEAKLREKFGVGKAGEQIAIIVESENNNENTESNAGFWTKTKDFFKSLIKK